MSHILIVLTRSGLIVLQSWHAFVGKLECLKTRDFNDLSQNI